MRKPTSTLTVLILLALMATASNVGAQALPPQPTSPQSPPPPTSTTPSTKRVQPYVTFTGVFDSNIDHDKRDANAVGGVIGGGIHFLNNPVDPTFEVNGEVAGHRYSNGDRWDRFSQKLWVAWQHDLPGRWNFDATGEISLKGSTEDREISDQYVVVPRLAYRINSQARLRLYGALRARRYDDDAGRNAFNRYVGVEFTERASTNRRWEADVRYEVNGTESPRQHYVRWTFATGYSFLLGDSDRVELEMRFRMQRYPFRLVDVDDTDVQRRDHRWIPKVTWTRPLTGGFDMRAGYTLETRTSNDPSREFTAHLVTVTLIRYWR